MQQWILSVAQNCVVEWCHRFFKVLFKCFDSNVPLDESFYLQKLIYGILVDIIIATIASSIQSPSMISTAHYKVAGHCKVRCAKDHFIYLAKK